MKKLLAIALVAAIFTSCDEKKTDTTTVGSDTTQVVETNKDTMLQVTDTIVKTTTMDVADGDKNTDNKKTAKDTIVVKDAKKN